MRLNGARTRCRQNSDPTAPNLFAVSGLLWSWTATLGTMTMTETTHGAAMWRHQLLEAAHEEMAKFERQENEFRRKDRQERAAELHLPLNEVRIH
ncbi:hypothetical protein ASG57_14750 [Bradyrhizobium sp. Leaf396]|jgi:hypothetical protein|nr:hypothetical protein ASG57_14750 [Bradyrhizobium sp. Leaf396]